MFLKKRELILLSIYLTVIFSAGAYFFVSKFIISVYATLKEEIKSAENMYKKLNNVLSEKDAIESEYKELEKKLVSKRIQESLSTQILNDIKRKAGDASLNVMNIKPYALKDQGLCGTFDFKMETEGELNNLAGFLYDLDDSPYVFAIKFMQINAQTQSANLKIQLLLSAMFAKE